MRIDRLQATAQACRHLRGKDLDAELAKRGITDPTERIAIKLELQAQGLVTDEVLPRGTLRSDRFSPGQGGLAPAAPSPISEAQRRVLARAGIKGGGRMNVALVDMLLKPLDLGVEERVALKCAMAEANMLREDEAPSPKALPRKDALDEIDRELDEMGVTNPDVRRRLRAMIERASKFTEAGSRKTSLSAAAGKPGKSCKMVVSCRDFDALRR